MGQHSWNQVPSGRPTDRSCARRFAGDWTADGMSCPPRREHLIIRLQVSPGAAVLVGLDEGAETKVLFIGDDWAEDHHDVELADADGRLLARARLPEGLEGIARLHALVAEHAPAAWADLLPERVAGQVVVGIETDRGPWVTALHAAGYLVSADDLTCRFEVRPDVSVSARVIMAWVHLRRRG